ncbi:Sen15 protein [Teratosphaeria destructans]|uniref:Sen15 protein n=1 Tax=Teratosphaeria destructans TaxID=418781 RepID=A0A9W7W478_9PEZI|nr:Sen15 protein [Teratosphaeria destructans]
MSDPDMDLSAVQNFIAANSLPKESTHEPNLHHLALQIAHNLRFQHEWSEIRLHYHFQEGSADAGGSRPVISGLPPKRLYVHPDEQIELLQKQHDAGKAGWPDVVTEREWVLPSHLREPWTLRRFAQVFDRLSTIPPDLTGGPPMLDAERLEWSPQPGTPGAGGGPVSQGSNLSGAASAGRQGGEQNPWRLSQPKRMLLGTLDDDSTVVYYIVHDGIVKPRQN